MPRMKNTFNAQTPWGQGLNNIASAMFDKPSQSEMEKQEALMSLYDAQAGEGMMRIRNNTRRNEAQDSIAGVFNQLQMLQQQSDGMEDPGMVSYMRTMPAAVAKHTARGMSDLDPSVAGALTQMAMSQDADEDMLRRLSSSFRGPAGTNAAFTMDGVNKVNEAKRENTRAQALAQGDAQINRMNQEPVMVRGPDGEPIYMRTQDAIEQRVPVIPKSSSTRAPIKLTGNDMEDMYSIVSTVAQGKTGSDLALPPEVHDQVTNRAMQLWQETRNPSLAAQQAWDEVIGDRQFEEKGNTNIWPSTWFNGEPRLEQKKEPPATAAGSAAPPASQGGGPTPGRIYDGFIFKGGNPNSPENWEPAT